MQRSSFVSRRQNVSEKETHQQRQKGGLTKQNIHSLAGSQESFHSGSASPAAVCMVDTTANQNSLTYGSHKKLSLWAQLLRVRLSVPSCVSSGLLVLRCQNLRTEFSTHVLLSIHLHAVHTLAAPLMLRSHIWFTGASHCY